MENVENCAICGATTSISEIPVPGCGIEILLLWKRECAKSLCDVLFECDFESPFLQYFENGKYCSYCLQIIRDVNFTWKQLMGFKRNIEKQSTEVYCLLNNNYHSRKNKPEAALSKKRISALSDKLANNLSSFEILERIYCTTLSKLPAEKLVIKDRISIPIIRELLEVPTFVKEEHIELEFKNEPEHIDFDDNFVNDGEDWHSAGETETVEVNCTSVSRGKRKKKRVKRKYTVPRRPCAGMLYLSKQEKKNKRHRKFQPLVCNKEGDSDSDLDKPLANWVSRNKKIPSVAIEKENKKLKKKKYERPVQNKQEESGSDRDLDEPLVKDANEQSPSKKIPNISTEEENEMLRKKRHEKFRRHVYNKEDECESDMDFCGREGKDDDWEPPSKMAKSMIEEEKEMSKKKIEEDAESDNCENTDTTDEDSNNDEYFESKARNIQKPVKKDVKNKSTEGEENRQRKNCENGLMSDVIIEDSEEEVLKKIIKLKVDTRFRLRHLDESELALVIKISQYSNSSIRRLKLSEKHKIVILALKRRVTDKARKHRNPNRKPKLRIFFHCSNETCSDKFKTEEEVEGHVREKHLGDTLAFPCTTCPLQFKTYDSVKAHRRKRHKGAKLLYRHFCKICQKGYKTEEELNTHAMAHQGANPFSCAFCDQEFTVSTHLVRHMNASHVELPPEPSETIQKLSCDKCGMHCAKESTLKKHLLRHENNIQPKLPLFNCELCSTSYSSESSLKYHMDARHTKIVCEICGKSVCKSSFPKHERRHSGKLPYECSVCGKCYKSVSQRSDHERTHSGIRSFVCSVCGKTFFTKVILQGHEKIHEPGYIPRKPFRRTKPNRKKKIQEPIPEADSHCGDSSRSNEQSQPVHGHRPTDINANDNSYILFQQPQPHGLSYEIVHPPGFFYHI